MSKYTPKLKQTILFEGDQILITMSRLEYVHMGELSPHIITSEEGRVSVNFNDKVKMFGVAGKILKDVVKEFTGLKDGNGNAVELDVVLRETYFMPVVQSMLGFLLESSFLKEDEVKKSELSPRGSTVAVTTERKTSLSAGS